MDCSTDKTDNQIAILWDTTYGMDWPLEINDAMLPGKPKIRDTCPGDNRMKNDWSRGGGMNLRRMRRPEDPSSHAGLMMDVAHADSVIYVYALQHNITAVILGF
ncbi:hypothetical protein V9T40_006733 [Parthenolecanium corni]|uniref:Uncharacterized protein n=1 Tax=Parthenolecanium corni TaxID=536013 RepID=A0AAN9U0C2_9HEMI